MEVRLRRYLVNALAVVGAVTLTLSAVGWVRHRPSVIMLRGRAVTVEGRPVVAAAVFLDRGSNTIERYLTDSTGAFRLPLFPRDPHRATWLICAPGMQERVGHPELDQVNNLPDYTYEVAPLQAGGRGAYRAYGWKGPIPRECPQAVDSIVWRLPASSGQGYGSGSYVEPDWSRYPGPPPLPADR